MRHLIIFDLDGTLVNTLEDLADSINYAMRSLGLPVHSTAAIQSFVGNGIKLLVERAVPIEKREKHIIESAYSIFVDYYNKHNTEKSVPYIGMNELMLYLQKHNCKIAVASNKYQSATEKIVHYYFSKVRFASIMGEREGVNIKPDPVIVHNIMTESKIVDKKAVLYVGDSGTDIQTAINSGVKSCAVTWGYRTREELELYMPTYIVNTPTEIYNLIV